MIRKIFPLFLVLATATGTFSQSTDFVDYIERYKVLAIREMDRAGVPASIKIAQALLESNAGRSELARRANNHFGIKCGGDWTGKTFHREDDDYDEFGNLIKSCFRSYRDVEDSYVAHSEFLRDPRKANRYGFLFRLQPTDYVRWARGLRTSGYATSATYDQVLIRLIETYKLYELDRMSGSQFPDGRPERPGDIILGLDVRRVNDVKTVFAKNNITVQEISLKTNINANRLGRYNDKLPAVNQALVDEYPIFLQPKRCRYRGKRKWHYVKEGESLFDISQTYAVKLSRLQKRNRIPDAAEPQDNQRIKLKGWNIKTSERPRLLSEPAPTLTVPTLMEGDDGFMQDDILPETPSTGQPGTAPVIPTTPTTPTTPTGPVTTPTQPSGAVYHTVVKGDTLFSISRRQGTTVDEIVKLNGLTSTTISIGQVLRVK